MDGGCSTRPRAGTASRPHVAVPVTATLGRLDELPDAQAELVRTALAPGPPRAVDRLALGAASLALLAATADERLLVVLVDDLHRLDIASRDALLFAARRVASDAVAFVFAARNDEPLPFDASGIQTLVLEGLGRDDAAALLDGLVAAGALETLMELTRGNPLALLELPTTLSDAQLLGRESVRQPLRVGARVEHAFARRALVLGERRGRT